jgi:hypothetical protein
MVIAPSGGPIALLATIAGRSSPNQQLSPKGRWSFAQAAPTNWLFAGSLRAGKRAAAIMSLVHSAKMNGHDPYAYLKDILERLPTQPASRIQELLPHRWSSTLAQF